MPPSTGVTRRAITALLLTAALLPALRAATLQLTVKDPSQAVVPSARIRVLDSRGAEVATATTDKAGRASLAQPPPGDYKLVIEQSGFAIYEQPLHLTAEDAPPITAVLVIQKVESSLDVGSGRSAFANADPNYRALREGTFGSSYAVQNLVLKRDVGVLTLRTGVIDFFRPVLGRVVFGVFTGEGEFSLKPAVDIEAGYMRQLTGKPEIQESFRSVVLSFTDDTYSEVAKAAKQIDAPARGGDALKEFRNRMRHRTDNAISVWDSLLGGEDVANVDAELLADIYDTSQPRSFAAYIHGNKHGDLRFLVKPRGAVPQLPSPEEVGVIRFDPQGETEGAWYLSHLESEWKSGTANSHEDKRLVAVEHYRIETAIGKNDHLSATCELRMRAVAGGPRVLKFSLLPSLRVTKVSIECKEIHFIQESRKQDGSFYAILPEPLRKDAKQVLIVEYEGNKVVEKAGPGNFYVGARTSWYPSVNAFTERSTFDPTFKTPKNFKLIGVGKLVKEWKEGDYAASQWVSETPLATAGFNYGDFKSLKRTDEQTKYAIEAYATKELPGYLQQFANAGGPMASMNPSRLAEDALVQAQNSIRLFQNWFGELPFGRIAITQQPDFSFGQSWPTLVYLPISAFLDSTQRWSLMGGSAFRFAEFIDEVTPHEVAHQWWGHIVGWATYHDQWLSEGFADFSAGLYLQFTNPNNDKFVEYWKRARTRLFEKNQFGIAPNDAGPVWLGLRLDTHRTPGGYSRLVYPKGGFVLHMLRQMMRDSQTGDKRFIEMMHDFVKRHYNQTASTESFKLIAEKFMTKDMDLDGNGKLDWFFSQWVYGTAAPKYRLEYSTAPQADGSCLVKGKLTQSGIPDTFKMRVQLYMDFDGKLIRAGSLFAQGSKTMPEFTIKLPKKPKRVLIDAMEDVLAQESISKEIT